MTESRQPDDIWALIQKTWVENREAYAARDELMAKHLVNGSLLITPAQYAELRRIEDAKPINLWGAPGSPVVPLNSVPVIVVPEDGRPVDVGNDQVAIYAQKAFWIMHRAAWRNL